jgi:DNA polymerase-3 subunit gamma/tau
MIFDLVQALLDGNAQKVLDSLDVVHQRGHDMKRLYADLVEHFRHLMVVKLCRQTDRLVDLPAHEIQHLQEQVASVSTAHLNQLFDLLFKEEPAVKFSAQPKIAVEMACFRLLQAKPTLTIETLIEKLDTLRRQIEDSPADSVPQPADIKRPPTDRVGADVAKSEPLDDRPTTRANVDAVAAAETLSSANLQQDWKKIQAAIATDHPSLAANLQKCRPRRVADGRLEIEVGGNGFTHSMIKKSKNLDIIRNVCRETFGRAVEIVLDTVAETSDSAVKKKEENQLRNEAMSHPLVAEAVKIFNGEVLGVTIIKEDES